MTNTLFVNINNIYDLSGDGSTTSPLNWTQFLIKLLEVENTVFKLSGFRLITSDLNMRSLENNIVESWLKDPWRIQGQGASSPNSNLNILIGHGYHAPILKNGIIELDIVSGLESSISFGSGATKKSFYNLYLISRHHGRHGFGVINNNSGGCSMYGCVFVATSQYRAYQNTLLLNNSFNSPFYYESCVFTTNYDSPDAGSWGDIFIDDGHILFKDCVFDRLQENIIGAHGAIGGNNPGPEYVASGTNRSRYVTFDGCQFGWNNDPTTWPGASGTKTDFSQSVLGHDITISGNGLFNGYDRDMFGDPRSGVGCFSNYPTPSIAPPSISSQPHNQTKKVNETVSFSFEASGRYLSYQWRKNGANIVGERSPVLTITNLLDNSSGDFDCVVINPVGSTTTDTVTLTITPLKPIITTHPEDISANLLSSVQFSVIASGSAIEYQWRKNGVNIPGANASTLSIPSFQVSDLGIYDVRVFNGGGFEISFGAILSVSGNSPKKSGEAGFSTIGASVVRIIDVIKTEVEDGSGSFLVFLDGSDLKISKVVFDPLKPEAILGSDSTTP